MLQAVRLVIPRGRILEIARAAGPKKDPRALQEHRRLRGLLRHDELRDTWARAAYLRYLGGSPATERDELLFARASAMGPLLTKTRAGHYAQMAWSLGILAFGSLILLLGALLPLTGAGGARSLAFSGGGFLVLAGVLLLWWDLRRYRAWQTEQWHPPRVDSSVAVIMAVVRQLRNGAKASDLIRPDGTVILWRVRTAGLPRRVRQEIEEAKASGQ